MIVSYIHCMNTLKARTTYQCIAQSTTHLISISSLLHKMAKEHLLLGHLAVGKLVKKETYKNERNSITDIKQSTVK